MVAIGFTVQRPAAWGILIYCSLTHLRMLCVAVGSDNSSSSAANAPPPCIPKAGRTGLILGQDYDSIVNYTSSVHDNRHPFGVMTYTALHNEYGTLPGLVTAIDYGSGIEWISGLIQKFPQSTIQLGLWFVDQSDKITSGDYDVYIDQLAQFVHSATVPFYIRIGYEFDSLDNNYPTKGYTDSFRRIVTRFRALQVTNAAFVWHASGFKPRGGKKYSEWFPGTEYVDWCGVSLFQQPYDCQIPTQCQMPIPDAFATFCKGKKLPLMIAESTPFGGIVDEATAGNDPLAVNEAGYKGSSWNSWFTPVMAFIERHDVKLWSYINCDWDSQPMWQQKHEPGSLWGDTRIEAHGDILNRWIGNVLNADRFLNSYSSALDATACSNIAAISHGNSSNSGGSSSNNSTDSSKHSSTDDINSKDDDGDSKDKDGLDSTDDEDTKMVVRHVLKTMLASVVVGLCYLIPITIIAIGLLYFYQYFCSPRSRSQYHVIN